MLTHQQTARQQSSLFQAVELRPRWAKGHFRAGFAKQELGDWSGAVDAYERGAPAVLMPLN